LSLPSLKKKKGETKMADVDRSSKTETGSLTMKELGEKDASKTIEIKQGNELLVIIQFLSAMNKQLADIKTLLEGKK